MFGLDMLTGWRVSSFQLAGLVSWGHDDDDEVFFESSLWVVDYVVDVEQQNAEFTRSAQARNRTIFFGV